MKNYCTYFLFKTIDFWILVCIIAAEFIPVLMKESKKIETDARRKMMESRSGQMLFAKHWQITLRVIGITLGVMVVFGSAGYYLDQRFGRAPMITIGAVLLSYPLSQYLIYKVFNKITSNKN